MIADDGLIDAVLLSRLVLAACGRDDQFATHRCAITESIRRAWGFSASAALAQSKSFAAAIQADSYYLGYMTRLLFEDVGRSREFDIIVGAAPVGEGLNTWFQRAASFSTHRITAPLLVMNYGP